MDELVKTLKQNQKVFFIAVAALMFVFIAFCPIADVMGKYKFSGFDFLFKEGVKFGYRLLSFLFIIDAIALLVCQLVDLKLNEGLAKNLNTILAGAAVLFFLIFAISLSEGVSVAFGAYLYLLLALVGLVGSILINKQ